MIIGNLYQTFTEAVLLKRKLLAILMDPEKFNLEEAPQFLRQLPADTTHIFVGGSTVPEGMTEELVKTVKLYTAKPVIIFPGDHSQITAAADALLFLSLLSGRNPEYLIGQQVKAIPRLRTHALEVISTGYILIDGGNESAVSQVTQTGAMDQQEVQAIVDTAKAGELMGAKTIYLEAGSGAIVPVSAQVISAVRKELSIPLIVGGGIRSEAQKKAAYDAGANMVVMGTAFEGENSKSPISNLE
ncbi:MAG: geranylgeranylglyceryl/heptaprenylglyceryl phosphate synthase [Bacteroidota bacterium]